MSQIDEVRGAADIVKIVGDYVKLRKAGVNLMGLCPFHQEKTPSFAVHPTKQIFHCFGCGVGGDVFKFVMLIENLSFPEALRRVADKVGITLREAPGDESDQAARERGQLYKLHEAAAKFYAAQLTGTAEGRAARAYLADRGLADEVVARFRLGYAASNGQALTRHLSEAGFTPEQMERSGLVQREAESGIDCPAVVKDKAFAFKMGVAAFFKVFQNTAVELVNIGYAGFLHKDCGFFAANPACAKTHDRLALQLITVVQQGLREFGELVDAPVNRVLESAHIHFKRIARVQRDHRAALIVVPAAQPALERGGVHGRCAARRGPDVRVVHADDFRLDLHQQLAKRLRARPAFLDFQVVKTNVDSQPCQKIMNVAAASR